MQIKRVEELRLNQEQEQDIAELLAASFSVDFEGRSFFQNRHHVRFLVYNKVELVGHLALSYRAIHLGERRLNIVGIGEVVVAPNSRRKGIGLALVNAAIEEGKMAKADFAALFGVEEIYAAAGFSLAANRIKLIEMEGARSNQIVEENNPSFMVKPLHNIQWDNSLPVDLAGFAF